MADDTNTAELTASETPVVEGEAGKPAVTHEVVRPIGEEFPLTDHQSIAAKLKAEFEHIEFIVQTDVEAGVHKLVGWLKAKT